MLGGAAGLAVVECCALGDAFVFVFLPFLHVAAFADSRLDAAGADEEEEVAEATNDVGEKNGNFNAGQEDEDDRENGEEVDFNRNDEHEEELKFGIKHRKGEHDREAEIGGRIKDDDTVDPKVTSDERRDEAGKPSGINIH